MSVMQVPTGKMCSSPRGPASTGGLLSREALWLPVLLDDSMSWRRSPGRAPGCGLTYSAEVADCCSIPASAHDEEFAKHGVCDEGVNRCQICSGVGNQYIKDFVETSRDDTTWARFTAGAVPTALANQEPAETKASEMEVDSGKCECSEVMNVVIYPLRWIQFSN